MHIERTKDEYKVAARTYSDASNSLSFSPFDIRLAMASAQAVTYSGPGVSLGLSRVCSYILARRIRSKLRDVRRLCSHLREKMVAKRNQQVPYPAALRGKQVSVAPS